MQLTLAGLVVIVGAYGSGKTEVAVNLALHHRGRHPDQGVRIADLDLVNPYFRTREARAVLGRHGIDVALPPDAYLNADLPILDPVVAGLIRNPAPLTLLDVGGDAVGARVLGSLADAFAGKHPEMLQVVNPARPFTGTVDGCEHMRRQIEDAARLPVTGLIGNAHLMDATEPGTVTDGYAFVRRLAERNGLPLRLVAVSQPLLARVDTRGWQCPVLPLERHLAAPWG